MGLRLSPSDLPRRLLDPFGLVPCHRLAANPEPSLAHEFRPHAPARYGCVKQCTAQEPEILPLAETLQGHRPEGNMPGTGAKARYLLGPHARSRGCGTPAAIPGKFGFQKYQRRSNP